ITYRTLIGLLAVSGLRVGEAIGLDRDDVDDRDGLVRVINGKFGICRNRHIPNYVAPRTMLRWRLSGL
ncbi:MAG: tyrosine-type recombinase/integrase, partial [Solirubrobacteraceae bacterium]